MANIDIEYDDREVVAALRRLAASAADLTPAMRAIAAALEDSAAEAFESESSPAGAPWADLSDVTTAARERRGKWPGDILQVTGNLADSIDSQYDDTQAVVGTNVVYAATQQFGAAKGAFGTTSRGAPIPWGDIPARPFLGVSDEARAAILDAIRRQLDPV